jgi:hypothetical protein
LKLTDIANRVVIDPRKLTHYVLDPNSPRGKHKAVLFRKLLGFTKENYTDLVHQLETKSLQAEATLYSEDEFGKRYTVDVLVEGMEGQQATIRAGWLVPAGTNEAHLVTLYVKKE